MDTKQLRLELLRLTDAKVANPDLHAWITRAKTLEQEYVVKDEEQPAKAPQQSVPARSEDRTTRASGPATVPELQPLPRTRRPA